MKKKFQILMVLVITLSPGFLRSQEQTGPRWTIFFENTAGEEIPGYCEVADTDPLKHRGLMFRENLGKDDCMIFIYEDPIILSFWMKNTLIPLSIAFIDANQRIIEIYDMRPQDESIITSTRPGIYAVEVNRGWFRKNHVLQGSRIRIVRKDTRKL